MLAELNCDKGGNGSSVGMEAASPAGCESWAGLGACTSMIHPPTKLPTLARVIQKRMPIFTNLFIMIPHCLLVDQDTAIRGDGDQAALLQGTHQHLDLLNHLLVLLDLRIGLGQLLLQLLFALLVLLFMILIL